MSIDTAESLAQLVGHLAGFPQARVVVVGDIMLDRFVYGAVERISPEAPIPVLRVERDVPMLGGAGNVASNVSALGAAVDLVAVVGADAAGAEIGRLLGQDPRIRSGLAVEAERATTVKTRFVGHSQQLLRVDSETTRPIAEATRIHLQASVEQVAGPGTILLLSDYAKGVLAGDLTPTLIALGRRLGCQVVVDPKGRDYSRYAGAHLVTPNNHELADASHMPCTTVEEVTAAALLVMTTCGIDAVLATRGAHGMSLIYRDGTAHHVSARAREVFDVSGAGDTAIATLSVALGSGVPLEGAVVLANAAAGISVSKLGTATCSTDELAAALATASHLGIEAKIADRAQLTATLARWRHGGRRIGFTNGCFDILHPGHVSLLRQARAACDHLIVGLNTDESVSRLKGPTRPINHQLARAMVLASLGDVDMVTLFDEDTPLRLIEAIRPDVLVKGADYAEQDVVGGSFVRSYGGRILLAGLSAGFSTTGIVAKMVKTL